MGVSGPAQAHETSTGARAGSAGTVAFTFDDGPSATYPPQVLDVLAEHRVRATFCLVGSQAQRFPALVRRIVAEGHRLSWTVDPRDWSRPGVDAIVQAVRTQLRPGGIVLMHDAGGDRSQTVQALDLLLPQLREEGWTFTFPPVPAG